MKPDEAERYPKMIARPAILKISPTDPADDTIKKAALIIKAGGIIAYPTRCLYGLAADAFNNGAVRELFTIKQRSPQKPILILVDGTERLEMLVSNVSGTAAQIMRRFWPGKVTLVFDASDTVPAGLTGGSRKIGIRRPGHPAALALVKAVGRPITGTSANLSGHPGCHRVSDLAPALARHLDLVLDAGPLAGGRGSTVVDVTAKIPQILREGVISEGEILAAVGG